MGIGKIPVVGNIVDFLTGKNNLPDGVRSQDIESIDFETYDTGEEIKNTTKTVYEDYSITNQYTDKDGNVITYTLDPSGGRHKEIYTPDGKNAKYDIDRNGDSIFISGDSSINTDINKIKNSESRNMSNDHLPYNDLFISFDSNNIDSINLQKEKNDIEYGIDVAEHDGDIDWNKVKSSGVDYAYIRVNYRGYVNGDNIYRDSKARENVLNAIDAGIEVNLYSFSVPKNPLEAKTEAYDVLNFIDSLPIEYQKKINKIACDHEVYDFYDGLKTRVYGQTKNEHTENIKAFNKVLNDHNYKTTTYASSSDFANSFDSRAIQDDNSDCWIASYEASPENFYSGTYQEWQYTDKGRVEGINTNVDLDVRKK